MRINWFQINSKLLINLIGYVFKYSDLNAIRTFINYCKQGHNCKDCNRNYIICKCNDLIMNREFFIKWVILNLNNELLYKVKDYLLYFTDKKYNLVENDRKRIEEIYKKIKYYEDKLV